MGLTRWPNLDRSTERCKILATFAGQCAVGELDVPRLGVDMQGGPRFRPTAVESATYAPSHSAGTAQPAGEAAFDAGSTLGRQFLLPNMVGVMAFLIALALRYGGILVGPLAVLAVIACIVFLPGTSRVSTRVLVALALVLGWLPLLGWIPALGTALDVPGILLALGIGIASGYQFRARRARRRTIPSINVSESVALAVGGAAAVLWGLPFWRLNLTGRLRFLYSGYDNLAHYATFRANLQLGSFITVRRQAFNHHLRYNWDYPQGIHQAWAQLARLWNPHPPNNLHWLLNAYSVMLLLTSALVVILLCMAIARICPRAVLALPAMAVVIALFLYGRFWPYNSFPNFNVAVAAAAVAILVLVRPTLSPLPNFLLVSGFALAAAYNWFPIALLAASGVVVAALRLWSATQRRFSLLVISVTALFLLLPVGLVAHNSNVVLTGIGGIDEAPWSLFIVSLAVLIALVVLRNSIRPDFATSVALAAPAVFGGIAVGILAAYQISKTGTVHYYEQKLATGVLAVCLIVIAGLLALQVAESHLLRHLPTTVVTLTAVLLSAAAFQIDGYVGPSSHGLMPQNAAYGTPALARGIYWLRILGHSPRTSPGFAELLNVSQSVRRIVGGQAERLSQWWYVEARTGSVVVETAQWFAVLKGDSTENENTIDAKFDDLGDGITEPGGPSFTAKKIEQLFPHPSERRFHLIVDPWLANALIEHDRSWLTPGVLWTPQQLERASAKSTGSERAG